MKTLEPGTVQESASERMARVIFEHAAIISKQTDVDALLQLNADLARDLLGADRCSLWLLDEQAGELWTKVAHGITEIRIPMKSGLAGASFHSGETILVNDLASDKRFYGMVDSSSGYVSKSVLCVPLHADGTTIGVLQALNKAEGFSAEDAEILRFMSIYSASAIQSERLRHATERARVLRRELDIAADVQQRLLPQRLLNVPGIECVGLCRPAKTVGGDFFDFLELADGSFGITLGDVAGKGFPAAVLMASIHTLLRHLLLNNRAELADVLGELNKTVYLSSSAERYATLFCGILSADRTILRFVNAGHVPPMILRRQDGTIDSFQDGDMPLGLLPIATYREHTMPVYPGDTIVCISDGILEAEDAHGVFWDPSTIDATLIKSRHGSVDEIVTSLVNAVDTYAGKENQFDDMTVVAVRVSGAAG